MLEVARAAAAAPRTVARRRAPIFFSTAWSRTSSTVMRRAADLARALTAFGAGMSVEEELRWLWLAGIAAMRHLG